MGQAVSPARPEVCGDKSPVEIEKARIPLRSLALFWFAADLFARIYDAIAVLGELVVAA